MAGRQVTVQAQSQCSGEKKEGERVVYRERLAASYTRTSMLLLEGDQTESMTNLDQGVLTLVLPKPGVRNAAQLTVS